MIEHKVQILMRATGKPINDSLYNEFGARVWFNRIAKKYGYNPEELMISEVLECERIWG